MLVNMCKGIFGMAAGREQKVQGEEQNSTSYWALPCNWAFSSGFDQEFGPEQF